MNVSEIEEYAINHTTDHSQIIKELIHTSEENLEHIDMLSGRLVGRLLGLLIKISGAKRVLEVGTFAGYSALTMAEALPEEGELFTCEYNERYQDIARTYFARSEAGSKITLLMGKALEKIPTIKGTFDFVFIDADKINYPNYYTMILPRVQQGGVMVIDNVFWSGEVLNPKTDKAEAIDQLSKMIRDDDSVEQVILPVRDGVTIIRKK
jgi:caffeoyl-CoA O-methyltransferase